MGKTRQRRRLGLVALLGIAALTAGCKEQDTEAMTRIGKKLAAVAGEIQENLGGGWQGLYDGMSLEARIAARLHWDRNLADSVLHVKATGTEIELKGSVQTHEQKRRAVELAETTAGVERVTDDLEVTPK
jgi:osmotically-inducible protein OsmY